jgi:hypothetical protein
MIKPMKKTILSLLLALSICVPSQAYDYFGGYDEGKLRASNISTDTTEFDTNLSSSDSNLQTALETLDELAGGGSGDVESVGDCTSGACLDGTSDGGTYINLYPTSSVSHAEGVIYYDSDDKAPVYYNEDSEVSNQIGRENWIRVYNDSGGTINNGEVVYASGKEDTEDRLTIDKAQADAQNTSRVLGFATHDIEDSSFGYVTQFGYVHDLDTSSFSDAESIWLDPDIAGAFTNVEPQSPNVSVFLGFVVDSHATTGNLFITTLGNTSGDTLVSAATEVTVPARKGTAGTITKGQLVYITGYNTGQDAVEVELADADGSGTYPTLGVANDTITNSANGDVIVVGRVANLNTSSYSVNDSLYLSTTAGAFTTTRPTGASDCIQKIANVVRSNASNGVIQVVGAGRCNDESNSIDPDRLAGDTGDDDLIAHEIGGLEADVSAYSGLVAIASGSTSEVDSKAELEAQIADVSDFAEADGDVYTGTHDFGGAVIEVDNQADCSSVTGEGQVCWDSDDDALYVGDGAAAAAVGGGGGWAEGSNTITIGDGSTGDKTMTFDGEGTYGHDATIEMLDTENSIKIVASGITDTGSAYEPVLWLESDETNTHGSVYMISKASNAFVVSATNNGYWNLLGHDGISNGGGLAGYRNEIYPADYNGTVTQFRNNGIAGDRRVDNTISFGSDSHSFSDMAMYTLSVQEQASAPSDTAGVGQIWVKNDTPNTLWFTDDAGTDTQLGAGGSSEWTDSGTYLEPNTQGDDMRVYYTDGDYLELRQDANQAEIDTSDGPIHFNDQIAVAGSNGIAIQGGTSWTIDTTSDNLRIYSSGTKDLDIQEDVVISGTEFILGSDNGQGLNGRLNVNGTVDEFQAIIQGHSTQTNDILVVEKSDGTDLFRVTNANPIITPVTVSALGAATAGGIAIVSDAADSTDCTTGSGSTYNLCIANGSAWIDA